jgi:catechol 2,3-dioxygenase-like lactoylglutathione lyase family enzyme
MKQSVIPQLRVTDAKRSLAFYSDALGFSVDWEHQFEPGFPLFLQITRQNQTVFLTEHTGDCQVGGAVFFWVQDADSCYAEFTQKGVVPSTLIANTSYGTREFVVTDPDGNRLRFATDLEPEGEA